MGEHVTRADKHQLLVRGYSFETNVEENLSIIIAYRSMILRNQALARFARLPGSNGELLSGRNYIHYMTQPRHQNFGQPAINIGRQVLLIADTRFDSPMPAIRIVTKDRYLQITDSSERVLAEDFSLVAYTAAQFMIHTYDDRPDSRIDKPVFTTDNGPLEFQNYSFTAPMVVCSGDARTNEKQPVRTGRASPYGKIDSMIDRLDALAAGSRLLQETFGAPIVTWGVDMTNSQPRLDQQLYLPDGWLGDQI